jgi:hypothetical protein
MDAAETAAALSDFAGRGAGTDAERRAAVWLAENAARSGPTGREVRIEPFWCRPNWALAHTWHVALALAGSLLAVHSHRVGGVLLVVALLSVIADAMFGTSLGRLLTPERASQNVVAEPPAHTQDSPVLLILTANYDAGRLGLVYRDGLRVPAATARRVLGTVTPGWLGWLVFGIAWLLAVDIARLEGGGGSAIGVLQLIPTVGLVLAFAALLELASSEYGPATVDNGTGVAAALAITRALDTAPPSRAAVELVLTGAGDESGIGLRRYLKARRRKRRADNTVVVGLAACGAGRPHWWHSDGPFVPVRHFDGLRLLCRRVAEEDPELRFAPYRGRGASPALPARLAGIPSITVGRLDERGLVPQSHQRTDTPARLERGTVDEIVELALLLTDAIDGYLATVGSLAPAARRRSGIRRWSRA